MKVCFVGSSYFSLSEKHQQDFVYHIAKRHPQHEFVNMSVPGAGWDTTASRVDYSLLNHNPDCFIIEISSGMRWVCSSIIYQDEPHEGRYRIQEYKNGKRFNSDMPSVDMLLLDTFQLRRTHKEFMTSAFKSGFDIPEELVEKLFKFIGMIDGKHHQCHIISECRMLQRYLEAQGKKVMFVEYERTNSHNFKPQQTDKGEKMIACCDVSNDAYKELNLFNTTYPLLENWMVQDEVIEKKTLDEIFSYNAKFGPNELSPGEQELEKAYKVFKGNNYYDKHHLNDEALKKFSSTFDELFERWN